MASNLRIFERPRVTNQDRLAMSITGALAVYRTEKAYESRLDINNSVGKCGVEVLESDLPSGSSVFVDNVTYEVVVKWPTYHVVVEESSLLPNGDFEDGDDGSWQLGPGWSIGSGSDYDTYDGTHSARFHGIKTNGSQIFSAYFPAAVNDNITASVQVQQGASSSGKAGAAAFVQYFDIDKHELLFHEGNQVKSGSNAQWHISTAQAGAPAGTQYVRIGVNAYRVSQNKPLWVDQVLWNHTYVLGQTGLPTYHLSIKVTDGINQVAYWEGDITGSVYTPFEFPVYGETGNNQTIFCSNIGGQVLMVGGWNDNLRRSTDGGATWSAVDYSNLGWPVGYAIGNIWDDPDTGTWYMAIPYTGSAISTDRGATWSTGPAVPFAINDRSVSIVDGEAWCGVANADITTIRQVFGSTVITLGSYWYAKRVAKINGMYYILTDSSNGTGTVLRGATMATAVAVNGVSGHSLETIAYGNGILVVASTSNAICVSADNGVTWANYFDKVQSVHFYGGKFYGGAGDNVYESVDGINWTVIRTIPAGGSALTLGAVDELGQMFYLRSQNTHHSIYSGDA